MIKSLKWEKKKKKKKKYNCKDTILWRTVTVLGSHVKRPQTISFVERGFERLGLGH